MSRLTGSDELPSICFVEGISASQSYGATVRKGGPCPECRAPVDNVLAFNPTDSYYYFHCPVCGVWVRWCDIDGTMADLKVVTSTKVTETDEELDPITVWTGTF